MRNKLSLLGFLGLVGLLGLFTDNPGFYGFFGFFGFFGFSKIVPDEMFKKIINKAAKNAFITGVLLFPIITIWGALTSFALAYEIGYTTNFMLQILVFSISLSYYEKNGGQEWQ